LSFEYFTWSNFDQFWTVFTGSTGMVGLFLIILQLWYVTRQIKRTRHQFELSQSAETSRIFFEVMDRWAELYPGRCSLLAKPPTSADDLVKEFGPDASKLLEDNKWQEEIRPILNFYEFLGVLLSNDKLDEDEILEQIFTLVTVDVYPNREYVMEIGPIYKHLEPYLTYLRSDDYSGYRSDIYKYYDQVLIPKYIAYYNRDRKNDSSKP